jgi:hypothetical protein
MQYLKIQKVPLKAWVVIKIISFVQSWIFAPLGKRQMSKELSRFVINNACEKFGLLLDFEQSSTVAINVSTWVVLWLLNVKSFQFCLLCFISTFHNKTHLNHYTKSTSLVFIFV